MHASATKPTISVDIENGRQTSLFASSLRLAYVHGMDTRFWRDRWAENKIGFHEGKPNEMLATHLGELVGDRVLVPLCGKSEDLAFLAAHGKRVVGVELVEDAVKQFFAEHTTTPTVTEHGALRAYTAGEITVFAGDWFIATPALVGAIDTFYDRAALIALPAELRTRYIAHLRTLVPAGAPGLVITVDYDQAKFQPPPHAVPDEEVHDHYTLAVPLQQSADFSGRLGEAGIGAVERCYAVRL